MKKRARETEREREKEKLTKKSERSCQLPTDREVILKREPSHKEVEKKEKRGEKNGHEMRTKEIRKMFLLYRPEIGCSEEKEKKGVRWCGFVDEKIGNQLWKYDCYLSFS